MSSDREVNTTSTANPSMVDSELRALKELVRELRLRKVHFPPRQPGTDFQLLRRTPGHVPHQHGLNPEHVHPDQAHALYEHGREGDLDDADIRKHLHLDHV